jgi:hypothetical protein
LKAFWLAFVFLLASLPAGADELPQTGNAWRATEPGLAEPGSFQWTVMDDAAGGVKAPAAANEKDAVSKSAPARAALAQIRAETQRVLGEARKTGTKVSRIRYDLRVRCLVEEVDVAPEAISEAATPYIWGSREAEEPESGTLELCEVDYSQKVRARPHDEAQVKASAPAARQPEMVDYQVAFPVD